MQATTARLSSSQHTATEKAALAVAATTDFVALGTTAEGVEIQDRRPLMARTMAPLKGRGILRQFGNGRFVVTAALWQKLHVA